MKQSTKKNVDCAGLSPKTKQTSPQRYVKAVKQWWRGPNIAERWSTNDLTVRTVRLYDCRKAGRQERSAGVGRKKGRPFNKTTEPR